MTKYVRVYPEPKIIPKDDLVHQIYNLYPGFISEKELMELIHLASLSTKPIVEIGSFKGKSTVALAIGSELGNKQIIYAVDPHAGTLTHKNWKEEDTLVTFIKNLLKFRVISFVTILCQTSKEAVENWDEEIGLLFIDGSHKYRDVAHDIAVWSKFLEPNGIIILHDFARTDYSTRTHPSVTRAGSKYILLSPDFTDYRIVDGMLIAKKV